MPEPLFGSYFKSLTRNIAKLIRGLEEESIADLVAQKAAGTIYNDAKELLLSNLDTAIGQVEEYNYPAFSGPLRKCFSNEKILTFTRNGIEINAQSLVGTWEELEAGIQAGRNAIKSNKKLTPEQAAAFWRYRIYGPARLNRIPEGTEQFAAPKKRRESKRSNKKPSKQYDYLGYGQEKYTATIAARKSAWTRAPYWLWLENGNRTSPILESASPFPLNKPTRFVYNSKIAIQYMYRDAIINEAEKFTEGFESKLRRFFENPDAFEPGTFLAPLRVGTIDKELYVTPTGLLGFRTVRK